LGIPAGFSLIFTHNAVASLDPRPAKWPIP
jgi:hypothetical protein